MCPSVAGSNKASFPSGAIAGISVGAAAAILAVIVAALMYIRRRTTTANVKRKPQPPGVIVHVDVMNPDEQVLKHAMDIPGLMKGVSNL